VRKFFVGLFLLLIVSPVVIAAGWITNDGTAKIKYINTENSVVRVHFVGNTIENPDECLNASSSILKADNPMFEQHYALILAAFMANKPIKIYANGCYTAWGSNFPVITALYVYE